MMRTKIMRDLSWDALVLILLTEGCWFGARWAVLEYMNKSDLADFMKDWYLLIAIWLLIVIAATFVICVIICMKRYNTVLSEQDVSDKELYAYYKDAQKCCQYRVSGPFVFINTTRGIICMTKADIVERKKRRAHHTKTINRTVHGNTRYQERVREYYTYHFELRTVYGTFKNTVANDDVLDKLHDLFN
jgi:hypothetical protein